MNLSRILMCIALSAIIAGGVVAAEAPISRVVLFSSGVGYFEREGNVEGDATIELSFRMEQIPDILKSLVLMDLGGGTIAPVTYAPQDPLERTLSSFAIDISDNPTIAEMWDMLRGARVRVEAEQTVEGIVFGAEEQEKTVGDSILTYDVLNLLTDDGFMGIPLWHVQSIKVLDEGIQRDLLKALSAIDKARDVSKRPVTLTFKGEGERAVVIGYLLETPVWKTSYRLVTDEDGLFLQGWAIVENTTDDDWDDVALSMVSGRPVSFIQDLYQPLYVSRPEIPVSVAAAARPRVWEGALEEAEEMLDEAAPMPKSASRRTHAAKSMMAGMGGGIAAPGAPPAPMMLGGAFRETQSMAAGAKVGTLFEYAIQQPVTVPRQGSAMIPIINTAVEGETLSVYNASSDPKHPMNGIKLKNTSGLDLMGGPITVFADGVYGGDALISDIAPDEERLLTYAMDLAVEVDPQVKSRPDELLSAKIARGVMMIQRKRRVEVTYSIKNSDSEERLILVEHPLDADWKLIKPEKADERTRNAYRFRVSVAPGKTEKLTVIQEQPRSEIIRLVDHAPNQIGIWLKAPEISAGIKAALQNIVKMQSELADLATQRAEKEKRIKEIEQEQDRIRKNMRELDRQSQLYKQYVQKFTQHETEFDALRDEIKELRAQEDAKMKALQEYILGLDIE